MTTESATTTAQETGLGPWVREFFSPGNRYLSPLLITLILVGAQVSFGVLESLSRTGLAIGVALICELTLGRLVLGKWPYLASAYITGISVGILIRSPWFWPYALCSAISIASKYALRAKGRHIWNPSNLGVSLILFLVPHGTSVLSIQWGNTLWTMAVIWVLGSFIIWRLQRFHICLTYALSFVAFAGLSSLITDQPFLATVAPITGPMYQLFIFFMITDPRTTVSGKKGQMLVAFLIALVEMLLRLGEVVYAPFYALFFVGPVAFLWEIYRRQ